MKKFYFLFVLMTCCIAGAWADEVTEKEALGFASEFVENHFKQSGRKGGNSELKSLGQVSGLYVFSMSDKGGFVIVSNESRTTHILGYSENGKFDADNMPDNMRAWLQGYADEIAWLQKQPHIEAVSVKQKPMTRAGSNPKTAVTPMIKTTWDQMEPYNNLCPPYNNHRNCATGCVATAMAQVMKYHHWPTSATAAIPSYKDGDVTRESLAATTFDWDNMINSYSGEYSDAQATAVATLMLYCGYSVKMEYGYESASNTNKVATALKTYFDYKSTTTFVARSRYSYDKWIDLIYYELAHNRPVVYGGQSSGGGHEFVCDGYKYENDTDLFHINWGWSGHNDAYYVLSVLNPYGDQGTGGSSSDDGFSYGQDAVIGIQPSNGTGTLSGITANDINLTINSVSVSSNEILLGESVTVTFNVTNNSSDDYDGDLFLAVNNRLGDGDMFVIPKNGTRDCVLTFTPSEAGTFTINCVFPTNDVLYSCNYDLDVILNVLDYTPTDLVASDITSSSAVLSWTQITAADAWKVCLNNDENNLIAANSNPFTLDGLTAETQYTVKVGSVVGNDVVKWSSAITFTTESLYPAPKNLTVSNITPNSAFISWTGNANANSYDVRYGVVPQGSSTSEWLKYDDGTRAINIGYSSDSEWTWGVIYPKDMITGEKLTKVSIYENSRNIQDIRIDIYSGGTDAPGTLLHSEVVTPQRNGFHEVTLSKPVNLVPVDNLWITLTESGIYPITSCSSTEVNNQWVLNDGSWCNIGSLSSSLSGYGWMIRGCIESVLGDVVWSDPVTRTESSYHQLSGLTPDKEYAVQVRSNYENDIQSDWATLLFDASYENVDLSDNASNSSTVEDHDAKEVCVSLTNRTLYKDNNWNTICLPFSLSDNDATESNIATGGTDGKTFTGTPLEGATVMELDVTTDNYEHQTGLFDGTLYLNFKPAYTIVAGTPYIIKWAAATHITDPVFNGVTIDKSIHEVTFTGGKFVGTYDSHTFGGDNNNILFLGGDNTLYYPTSGATIGAQRAYFDLTDQADVRAFVLSFGDEETLGIVELKNSRIEELKSDDAWYTLDGMKLDKMPTKKDVYIRNGRKVVIK